MAYFQRVWAQIDPEGTVQNLIVCDNYDKANELSKFTYGEGSLAVEVNTWGVYIGDIYKDNTFYAPDGTTPREYIPDVEEDVSTLKSNQKVSDEDMTDIQEALVELHKLILGGSL